MEEVLDIMFHHGGSFEKGDDGKLGYYPDNRSCLGDLEVDTLDVFYLRNYFKELGYDKMKEVWWLVPGKSLEVGLRVLNTNAELREMCRMATQNKGLVDIFIEHEVSSPELLQGNEVMIYPDDKVRDLREQAKANGTSGPRHCANLTAEKTPNINVSRPSDQIPKPKPTVMVPKEQPSKKKTKTVPKPTQTKVTRKFCLRSATVVGGTKGQGRPQCSKIPEILVSSDENSSEDEPYKPIGGDSSSDSCVGNPIPSCKQKRRQEKIKKSVEKGNGKGKGKEKEKICVDDDAFVEDVADEEIDLGFVGGARPETYDAYDPGTDSDGANSWHSLEMKTPPNSEDELDPEEGHLLQQPL